MYILAFLMLLLVGVWFLSLVVHIGVKVVRFCFEIELVIKVFGRALFKRKWQGDWFDRLTERWKESSNEQVVPRDDKNKGKMHGIVPNLLRVGRWKTFIWRAEVGLEDAMVTAIVVGSVWSLQGIIWERWIRDTKCITMISCRPNFGELMIYSEATCIVRFRFGDIIKEFAKGYLKSKRRKVA
ncbi:MAG: DUF2953 domain-containing protein [Selenomonadales bacterium]|nr:DUF2953 domain-containing protein [Selenomonadales bacterium]